MSYSTFKQVKLSSGKVARVDAADFDFISQWKWSFDGRYASRNFYQDGKPHKVYMHKLLTHGDGEVDHINQDKLDNRRSNLRLVDRSANMHNVTGHRSNTSGYKGVYWHKAANKWMAGIGLRGKFKYLGLFPTKEAAFAARKGAEA